MSMRTTILAALTVLSLSALGCASREDGSTGAHSALGSAPNDCVFQQHFPYVSDEAVEERLEAFRERNGKDWVVNAINVERRRGAVRHAKRTSSGPTKTLTVDEATVVAKAFLEKNADLLDVTKAELAAGRFSAPFSSASQISFYESHVVGNTAGYEPPLTRSIQFDIRIGADGEVERFGSGSGMDPTDVDLCAAPASDPSDALMLREVIGTGLEYVEPSFLPEPVVHHVGKVEAGNIRESTPVIATGLDEQGWSFTVAWRTHVERGGFHFYFIVDATTGAKISVQPGFGFIQ